MKIMLGNTLSFFVSVMLAVAQAADGPPPPSVNEPAGINLGSTSFYDGFTGPPGLSHLVYLRYDQASSFRDSNGHENRQFDDPTLSVATLLNQFSYYSPQAIWKSAHLGWNLIVPIVSLDGDFGDAGPKLKDNGVGLGDIITGPQVVFDPLVDEHGRPVLANRIALEVILPTGKYDKHRDLNQGSNFYSFNPYWASTWLPAPRWELSWRLYYLYNFKNRDPASSSAQIFEGGLVRDTQAGQAAWANFSASYELIPNLSVGISGYYFKQLEDDQVNGRRLTDSREKVLGIGPGLFWKISAAEGFWLNTYHEVSAENRAKNDFSVQVRFAHAF